MTFQFDTSGTVYGCGPDDRERWPDLAPFAQGYVKAMFESIEDRDGEGEPQLQTPSQIGPGPRETFMKTVGFSDIAPEALARIMKDCADFENFITGLGFKADAKAGERFWKGRQSNALTGAWRAAFPPLTVFLDPNGKVNLRDREGV